MEVVREEKRAAGEAAALEVRDGDAVGLGTGTTVAYFIHALASRRLAVTCVATSIATENEARDLGLDVHPFDSLDHLDVAVDGADQVGGDGWLVKGGGAAHTREKVVAAAAGRFVVIVSSDKLVERVGPPVPLEVLPFGIRATLRAVAEIGPVRLRDVPPSPDGNLIADYVGEVDDPAELGRALKQIPGVVEHGLFPPEIVTEVLVGRVGDGGVSVERLAR